MLLFRRDMCRSSDDSKSMMGIVPGQVEGETSRKLFQAISRKVGETLLD